MVLFACEEIEYCEDLSDSQGGCSISFLTHRDCAED